MSNSPENSNNENRWNEVNSIRSLQFIFIGRWIIREKYQRCKIIQKTRSYIFSWTREPNWHRWKFKQII